MKWLLNLMISSLIFFPEKEFYADPRDLGLTGETVSITTRDGVRLSGWYLGAPDSKATLLFFHGNAGNISGRLDKAKGWVERGVSVFLVDYRGYGKSEGKITKPEDLLEDAHAALAWLEEERNIPAERIILYGESIGSFPATRLAREKHFVGLVLEAPFTTLLELARVHYAWVPEFLLKGFAMNNEEAISGAKAPVFILHGRQDEICPVAMGERLYELAPAPKEFFGVPGGSHNDLPEAAQAAYFDNPFSFLARENGFR